MAKTSAAFADQVISLSEAATITAYSTTWILKLTELGYIKKLLPGKYRLLDVMHGIKKNLEAPPKTNSTDVVSEARAKRIENSNKRKAALLCETSQVVSMLTNVLGELKKDCDDLPLDGFDDEAKREIRARFEGCFTRADANFEKCLKEID